MPEYLANYRGTLTGGTLSEIFSHSLAIRSSASASAVAQACTAALAGRWPGPSPGFGTVFGTGVTYTEVTVASVIDLTLGKMSVAYHQPFQPPLVGVDAGGTTPPQNAIAVSVTAVGARPNGADVKGRFYLPTPAKSMIENLSGNLSSQAQTIVRDTWQSIFQDLGSAGHQVCVWSRTLGVFFTAQEMRVGDKVDTIRSRRNAAPELYILGEA